MKTSITSKRTRNLIALTLFAFVSMNASCQGQVIEVASKFFEQIRVNKNEEPGLIMHINYVPENVVEVDASEFNNFLDKLNRRINSKYGAGLSKNEFKPIVVRSFTIERIDITFEEEVETESWMKRSFSNDLESAVTVEEWMTEDFSASLEECSTVEEWMTRPISENFESELVVEEWMTRCFSTMHEGALETEAWMMEPISNNFEEPLQVEAWMTSPIYNNLETPIIVEDWMTQAF